MIRRARLALVVLGLTLPGGCAVPPGRNTCDFLQGEKACARPSLSASAAGPQVAAAQFFGDAGASAYEKRFLALLAQHQIGAMDRDNGTGPFGRDRRDVLSRDFQATYSTLQRLAAPVAAPHLPPGGGGNGEGHFDGRWRVSRQTLYIDAAARPSAPKSFDFSFPACRRARSKSCCARRAGSRPSSKAHATARWPSGRPAARETLAMGLRFASGWRAAMRPPACFPARP